MIKRPIALIITSLALTAVLLAVPCFAKTIIVDDDGTANYRKIQDAINASWDGDVIVVKPGTNLATNIALAPKRANTF